MIRKLLSLLLPILLLTLLTGCWNSRELNSLAIAVALGIDKVGDHYMVSAQVVVPSNIASSKGGDDVAVTMYKSEGKTVFEALRRMTTVAPRKIYLPHLRVLVLGEELAKEGIAKPLEFLSRDHEPRTDFFIVVAKHLTAENVLKVMTPLEKIPANKMYSSLLAIVWGYYDLGICLVIPLFLIGLYFIRKIPPFHSAAPRWLLISVLAATENNSGLKSALFI